MKQNIDKRTGVDISKINIAVIDQYLEKLRLSKDGSELIRVTRLHDAMQLVPNKSSKLGNCSECRGKSHIDLACCPFCGDGQIADDVETKQARESKPEDAVIAELRLLIKNQQRVDEQAATEKAEADKAKTAPPATAPSPVTGQSLVVVPATVLESKRAKKRAGKEDVGAQQSLVAPQSAKAEFTVADLDTANERIKTHLNNAGAEIYEAALVVFHVFENKLWALRCDENGVPKYSSFKDWVGAEQSITWQYAYELTNLPKYFTREQAGKIGSTKLTLSLRIDEEERRRLLESGDLEKMSVSQVKEAITQNPATQPKNPERAVTRDKNGQLQPGDAPNPLTKTKAGTDVSEIQRLPGTKPRSTKSKATPPASPPRVVASPVPPPRKPEPITLVTCVLPTQIEFDLVANEENKNRPPRKARDLSDDPVAFITCANGATMRIVFMKDADGNLRGMLTAESSHLVQANSDDEGDE